MQARKEQGCVNYYRKPILIVGAVILFYLWFFTKNPFPLPGSFLDLLDAFGALLMFIGVLGRVFSSLTISGKKNLMVVNTEIYSVVRHPLYFFSFLMLIGAFLLIGRIDLLIYGVFVFVACFFPMMVNEQKYLEKLYGDQYIKYKEKTPFFIPNFSLYKARDEITINTKLVTRTMLDASAGLLIIPILEIADFVQRILF